jgi:outer membrane receptor protein involved in Fe transport
MQGLGLGDMLLGLPFSASGALGDSSQKMRTTFYAGYIQDDVRVNPSLSLNLGLRYEYSASPTEQRGKALAFAPDVGAIMLANHGVRASIVDPDWNNFAPRVGIAYRPTFAKNTVVRGGFGIYYATDAGPQTFARSRAQQCRTQCGKGAVNYRVGTFVRVPGRILISPR